MPYNLLIYRVYNSMAFSIFTKLNTQWVLEHCHCLSKKPHTPQLSVPNLLTILLPKSQATTNLISISTDLPLLEILHKWNHTLCSPLWLAYFFQHNVTKAHSCQHLSVLYFFLFTNNIPSHRYSSFHLSTH